MAPGLRSKVAATSCAVALIAGFSSPAHADTTVKVSPANLNNWAFLDTTCSGGTISGSASAFRAGPSTVPAGAGSVAFDVGSNGDSSKSIRFNQLSGVALDSLTQLDYWTNIVTPASGSPSAVVYLALTIDFSGDTTPDDAIFFEAEYQHAHTTNVPDQGAVAPGVWQHWDALVGGWWANATPGVGPGANVKTIAQYTAIHPTARIINNGATGGVAVRAGCGSGAWPNFNGVADALTIGVSGTSTLFDFELDASRPTSTITFPLNATTYASAGWSAGWNFSAGQALALCAEEFPKGALYAAVLLFFSTFLRGFGDVLAFVMGSAILNVVPQIAMGLRKAGVVKVFQSLSANLSPEPEWKQILHGALLQPAAGRYALALAGYLLLGTLIFNRREFSYGAD